ncbi:hypothetical protein [Shewanella surugensis]|uniref:Excisionase n=1 Tax=Shewanella surugensis TaxID=212020 RepID=A0ABT0LAT7_9GAMM|nr:hypothetical protein [Shewanella surugensis]MCL1124480.1 hypothetical protein [Shewanella surugensis]
MQTHNTSVKIGWVKPVMLERLKGITYDALKKKRPLLEEGHHWRKAGDGVIYYHFEAFDEWLENSYRPAG